MMKMLRMSRAWALNVPNFVLKMCGEYPLYTFQCAQLRAEHVGEIPTIQGGVQPARRESLRTFALTL